MIKVVFLLRSLNYGGAERQLAALAKGIDRQRFAVWVLSFYGGGALQAELEAAGVAVISLEKQGRWDTLPFFIRLLRAVRALQPDVLHGYLATPNLLLVLLKPFLPRSTRLVFGIRASIADLEKYDWLARLVYRLERLASPFADRIIVNSEAGGRFHRQRGLPAGKITVIPNGIDTQVYAPDREAGRRLRAAWGLPASAFLIGMIGRLEPVKDHPTFLRAAARLAAQYPEARFIIVGEGRQAYRQELEALAVSLGLEERLLWSPARGDIRAVYNALDLCCSSSYSEGFSNVIGEAMACGVPCVATDVGDSSLIIGESGRVVPPRDPAALAAAFEEMARLPLARRARLGEEARQRVIAQFSLEKMVAHSEAAFERLAGGENG